MASSIIEETFIDECSSGIVISVPFMLFQMYKSGYDQTAFVLIQKEMNSFNFT